MRIGYFTMILFAVGIICAAPARPESILGALENIGDAANQANEAFLNSLNGSDKESYEQQMAIYRRNENARIDELSAATGVSPDELQSMRAAGATWEEIASKYGINLNALPPPPVSESQ